MSQQPIWSDGNFGGFDIDVLPESYKQMLLETLLRQLQSSRSKAKEEYEGKVASGAFAPPSPTEHPPFLIPPLTHNAALAGAVKPMRLTAAQVADQDMLSIGRQLADRLAQQQEQLQQVHHLWGKRRTDQTFTPNEALGPASSGKWGSQEVSDRELLMRTMPGTVGGKPMTWAEMIANNQRALIDPSVKTIALGGPPASPLTEKERIAARETAAQKRGIAAVDRAAENVRRQKRVQERALQKEALRNPISRLKALGIIGKGDEEPNLGRSIMMYGQELGLQNYKLQLAAKEGAADRETRSGEAKEERTLKRELSGTELASRSKESTADRESADRRAGLTADLQRQELELRREANTAQLAGDTERNRILLTQAEATKLQAEIAGKSEERAIRKEGWAMGPEGQMLEASKANPQLAAELASKTVYGSVTAAKRRPTPKEARLFIGDALPQLEKALKADATQGWFSPNIQNVASTFGTWLIQHPEFLDKEPWISAAIMESVPEQFKTQLIAAPNADPNVAFIKALLSGKPIPANIREAYKRDYGQ